MVGDDASGAIVAFTLLKMATLEYQLNSIGFSSGGAVHFVFLDHIDCALLRYFLQHVRYVPHLNLNLKSKPVQFFLHASQAFDCAQ